MSALLVVLPQNLDQYLRVCKELQLSFFLLGSSYRVIGVTSSISNIIYEKIVRDMHCPTSHILLGITAFTLVIIHI